MYIYDLLELEFTLFHAVKISNLEQKLKNDEDELRRKDRIILELEAHLEAARSSNNYQNQIEEISI